MILFKFRETNNMSEVLKGSSATAFRWVFEVNSYRFGLGAGFQHQFKSIDDGKWYPSGCYYQANLTSLFALGSEHHWHDGTHCTFSFGFLHLARGGHECPKVFSEGTSVL